nr:hypothetical protein [Tanacetum cinerariifolium]
MRTRSRSRHKIANPLRIEFPSQEDQFQEDPPEVSMDDNRTMAQFLQAPTVGYEDAIVIPEIAATNFELKHVNMASLADKAILSDADNHPPMIEKDMSDSWKSRMELYMLNRQHGRMILESVEHGPLLWPTIEEDGVTRLKKYYELSAAEAIQADCDVKAKNIILQAIPPEIYTLVSTYKVAKDLWERIQMLMQGTSLTKQERECKLYDEFDKFAYQKGETLCDFYLRFSLLLNDMNMYNMKLEQF